MTGKLPDELWTAREAAAWMKCSRATFYRFRAHPDFPKAVRPGGGHPRWLASEIIQWAIQPQKAA